MEIKMKNIKVVGNYEEDNKGKLIYLIINEIVSFNLTNIKEVYNL